MKRFTPIITFIAGCGFMLLISAKNQSTPVAEIPRYHLEWQVPTSGFVYDAVTGEIVQVDSNKARKAKNLKDLLNENKN